MALLEQDVRRGRFEVEVRQSLWFVVLFTSPSPLTLLLSFLARLFSLPTPHSDLEVFLTSKSFPFCSFISLIFCLRIGSILRHLQPS